MLTIRVCSAFTIAKELKSHLAMALVPGTRLELAHLSAYAPQTYVYTSFTTRAWRRKDKNF